jgi:Putative beta-barrel porin 2
MNRRIPRGFVLAFVVALSLNADKAAVAQEPADPVANAAIHLGVLGLTPRVSLTNVGVDNNVFNEADNPKRDFTFTTAPSLNLYMRTRRGLLSAGGKLDFVYFNTYRSERSVNGLGEASYEYAFNRFKPLVSFSALNTRERPGYEIDLRARRFENTLRAALQGRVASKSHLEVGVRRQTISYAGDAIFLGRRLEDVLNRTLWGVDAGWKQRLTPLTTLVVTGSHERERFELSPVRNSDSVRVKGGFELGQFALIRGTALVGYRSLKPVGGGTLPPFSGLTADVGVSYTAPTQTRISSLISRDVQYSFEIVNPYYVQTGWNLGLTQRIIGPWELLLSGGRDRLAYRTTHVSGIAPVDHVDHLGGGVGYRLSPDFSVGFIVESIDRSSSRPGGSYQTVRSFGSVNYGL